MLSIGWKGNLEACDVAQMQDFGLEMLCWTV